MPKIAMVSYINTRPFMDGFEQVFTEGEVDLQLLAPADCAKALKRGEADMALIPVGALSNFQHIKILPDFCIGAKGPVNSVFIFSKLPIERCDHIHLDPHSRSSNGLARILLKHYWRKDLHIHSHTSRDFSRIKDHHAGVVIGDEAIRIRDQYPYQYDLSEHWYHLTGLGFPFAVWAFREESFSPFLLRKIHHAMKVGVTQRAQSAKKWASYYKIDPEFAHTYLMDDIDFVFDQEKHKALKLYYKTLHALPAQELQRV
ncbi:MAG: menaquinone biosynthesis protein [Bacteroidota bacterium]